MPQRVDWVRPARRDLARLAKRDRKRISRAVERFVSAKLGDTSRLHGYDSPTYRFRVGDWRIRFEWVGGTCKILRVLHRREAYRKSSRARQERPPIELLEIRDMGGRVSTEGQEAGIGINGRAVASTEHRSDLVADHAIGHGDGP